MNKPKKPCCGKLEEPEKRSLPKAAIPIKELNREEIKEEVKRRYDEFA
ncbi:MAG: hypothetical protein ABIJ23_01030 [Candidatus Magasanikbacteria bacterium]